MFTPDSIDLTDLLSADFLPEFALANYVSTATGVRTLVSLDLTDVFNASLVPDFSAASYVNQATGVRTASSVDVTDLLGSNFVPELSSRVYQGAMPVPTFTLSRSLGTVILGIGAVIRSSTVVEFTMDFENSTTPVVPLPGAGGYELLYPVLPKYDQDVVLSQSDSVAWRRLQLTAPRGFDLLGYRIRRTTLDAMVGFFEDNRSRVVELYTPGLYPFGNPYVRSNVRLISYNAYTLEHENLFRIDVLYQFISGIA